MATLLITKKSAKTWLHTPSDELDFIIGKFTFSIDGDFFQIVELGQSKRNKYNFTDITVVDETTSTTYSGFTSIVELSTTLETLGYPAFLRDGEVVGVASVNGLTGIVVINGDNINVTNPTTSTETTLNQALEDINDAGGGSQDLQSVTDNGNTITDGTNTNAVSANAVSINDGVDYSEINKTQVQFTDFTDTATLTKTLLTIEGNDKIAQVYKDGFDVGDGVNQAILYADRINHNGTDYPLPTGASSPIATLADITGGGYTVVSASLTASNDTNYTVVANATFTDPTPVEGKGYVVFVRNGTATIGGTGYGVGNLVFRVYHSGAWSNRVYVDQTQVGSATQTALNAKQDSLTETNFGGFSNALTAKTTIVDADSVNIVDSADSNKAKKVTWLNVWTNYIKTKVDALLATKQPIEIWLSNTSAYTLTSQTALQKAFNIGTNGGLDAGAKTYQFEGLISLSSLSSSSGNISFGFLGTATVASIRYTHISMKGVLVSTPFSSLVTTANQTILSNANTNTAGYTYIKGIVRISSAGTFIPAVGMSTAAAAVVDVNSYFKFTELGSDTATNSTTGIS